MKKRLVKKLTLSKETLSCLDPVSLGKIQGGERIETRQVQSACACTDGWTTCPSAWETRCC
jgi:hypothetical protein